MDSIKKTIEKQEPTGLEIRKRILDMHHNGFEFLNQKYLADKLNRSNMAISLALDGKSARLLKRIVRHLEYLERKRTEKAA